MARIDGQIRKSKHEARIADPVLTVRCCTYEVDTGECTGATRCLLRC